MEITLISFIMLSEYATLLARRKVLHIQSLAVTTAADVSKAGTASFIRSDCVSQSRRPYYEYRLWQKKYL